MGTQQIIERFYYQGWNKRDGENILRECMHDDVKFRVSLLTRKDRGIASYLKYVETLKRTISNFTILIDDLVITENGRKVAVRYTSRGLHKGEFFGVEGSGYGITWESAAFLTIQDGKIVEIWVLGDRDSLKHQIGADTDTPAFRQRN